MEIYLKEREQSLFREFRKMGAKLDLNNYRLEEIDGYSLAMYLAEYRDGIELLHLGLNSLTDEPFFDILSTL